MRSKRNGSRNAARNTNKPPAAKNDAKAPEKDAEAPGKDREPPAKDAEPRLSRFTPGAYFRDRTVLITGASSGIGRDLALTFAKMGAKVALMARRKSLLISLADEIAAAGGEALPLAADVTRRAEVRDAVEQTLARFGRIDVLINSAGIAIPDRVESMPPEDLEQMMAVNLMGTLHTMQAVLPAMRAAGSGSIVNIASLAGRRGMPPLGAYCATKFAVVGLTEALRVELFGSGIRLSLVMPGVIDTPMVREPTPRPNVDNTSHGDPKPQAMGREPNAQRTAAENAAGTVPLKLIPDA